MGIDSVLLPIQVHNLSYSGLGTIGQICFSQQRKIKNIKFRHTLFSYICEKLSVHCLPQLSMLGKKCHLYLLLFTLYSYLFLRRLYFVKGNRDAHF